MEKKIIKIWYDKKGDYLEVLFERRKGYFRETENDAVMEKVDEEGNVIGFSILKVSALKGKPLSIELKSHVAFGGYVKTMGNWVSNNGIFYSWASGAQGDRGLFSSEIEGNRLEVSF